MSVEVSEAGGEPGGAGRAVLELGDGGVEGVGQGARAAPGAGLAEAEDQFLSAAESLGGVDAFAVEAGAHDLGAAAEEPAAQGTLLDDLDVALDPAEVGQVEVEAGEKGQAAHLLEAPGGLEARLQGAQVDRIAGLLQVEHGAVEELVALEVEVGGVQAAGHGGQRPRLEQHGGEHGALGFRAVRQRPRGRLGRRRCRASLAHEFLDQAASGRARLLCFLTMASHRSENSGFFFL